MSDAIAALVGRVLIGAIFVNSGFGKLTGFGGLVGQLAAKGLPLPWVAGALAVLFELGGGLALVLGFRTRHAAMALILFTMVATLIYHDFWHFTGPDRQRQFVNFMKNVAIVGGLVLLASRGGGRYGLDRGRT
ncbi:MAG TPA: DoxX family protein [Stellaceae bacterium]|jgi:putative oxidoreductase